MSLTTGLNRRRGVLAAGLLWLIAGPVGAQVPQVLANWTLDLQRSKLPEGFALASETRSYTLRDDGFLVVLAVRQYKDGSLDFIQISAKADGKDYPQYQAGPLAELAINGTATPLTYSERQIGERAVEFVSKYNGQLNNKGTRTISADGQTMTIDLTGYAPGGREVPFLFTFERVAAPK